MMTDFAFFFFFGTVATQLNELFFTFNLSRMDGSTGVRETYRQDKATNSKAL